MEIKNVFATLLEAPMIAHKFHLGTHKYSAHKALDEFYEDFPELVDTFIETYQGKYDNVGEDGVNEVEMGDHPIKYLEGLYNYIKSIYGDFEESELESCMDDMLTMINQTLYKLKKLDGKKDEKKVKEMFKKSLKDYITESLK